jgi:hypothetical protein
MRSTRVVAFGRLGVAPLADVHDVVPLPGEAAHKVVGAGDVAAGGVDDVEPAALGLGDDLRGDPVGGEDHRPGLDLLQPLHAVGSVDQGDAVLLELAGDVLVVHQVAEHGDLLALGALAAHPLGDADGLDHAVAVATRGDADNLHLAFQSTPGAPRPRPALGRAGGSPAGVGSGR